MKVDAIIFDKDGTLIDFDAFWVTVSVRATRAFLDALGMPQDLLDEILEAFGIHDGITDLDGILCKGTYESMSAVVYEILSGKGCTASHKEVERAVIDAYNAHSDAGVIKPTSKCEASVLKELKRHGKLLALVTTDNAYITQKCLEGLGVEALFDRIYTDDGMMPKKPSPESAFDFCRAFGVSPSRVAVVGDTLTDVKFARNAGLYSVGLAKNQKNRERLLPHADVVIEDLSQLLEVLE